MRIYLDHNATTPPRPEVVAAVLRVLRDVPGNASSTHAEGAAARAAVEEARARVATAIGAAPAEIVFTSGASEANHGALWGLQAAGPGGRLVTTPVEHPSVSETAEALEAAGHAVTRVPVDACGRLDPDAFAQALGPDVALASFVWGHHETGVLQPAVELAARAQRAGVPVHVDATQCLGRVPVDVRALGIDRLSASGHKLGATQGVGFLWVRAGTLFVPWQRGGPQERRRRAGTENVAAVVGLGLACMLAAREREETAARMARLRDRLWDGIAAKVPRVRRVADGADVLPNTLLVAFAGVDGAVLVESLDLEGVAASTGAACASGSVEPSPALLALGLPPAEARSCLRLSVGRATTETEIERVLALLPDVVARVRGAA